MRLLSFVLAVFLFVPLCAQKKEISQARSYIKSRSNLDKAEAAMRDLLKDSANRRNMKIYVTLADAVRAQYELANEKLYLNENADTAAFFKVARNMFLTYASLDSVDLLPDKKGRIRPKYRKKNAEYLNKYRRNLYNGGIYFIRKKNYDDAFLMMDAYINCKFQPIFTAYENDNMDSLYSEAAFWSVFCGNKLGDPYKILKYSDLALLNKKGRRRTLVYISKAYLQQKDTLSYVATLRRGFMENRTSRYFFTRLLDYYNVSNKLDSAMSVVNLALDADKDNNLFLFAKSNLLLNTGKYAECIAISDTLIARNDSLPDIYLNAGVSYINQALALEQDVKNKKKNQKKILGYYRKAMPYMEKYRVMRPDDKERWAQSLYNIYLRLNMGRKFEEISKILLDIRN